MGVGMDEKMGDFPCIIRIFSAFVLRRRDDGLPGRGQQSDGWHDRRRCRCGFSGAGEVIFLSIA